MKNSTHLILFLAIAGTITLCLLLILGTNSRLPESTLTIQFKEVPHLRCDGINALGCTTYQGNNHFLIEYQPSKDELGRTIRCTHEQSPYCQTINDTIHYEMNNVADYVALGHFNDTQSPEYRR
jgi:hypothetical protein